MPEISRFYGISIYMYFREHSPPHFHAVYGENGALISIETLGLVSGWLPPRVMGWWWSGLLCIKKSSKEIGARPAAIKNPIK
ncbi:MAG: DUF4160 domain-containing protein [Candidatus Brocadiaceae bacterium]|nr:DUF4160 domain-containing protein [Candidatus Brocadiaceae bacterium]